MLEVDFHTHTHFSNCGLNSHLEMLKAAHARGIKGLAITDHGPLMNGRVCSTFFERFENPVKDVRLLKGMECNLRDAYGAIDFPEQLLPYVDVVLLGLHPNSPRNMGREVYTCALIAAMEQNPWIDIITHPNDPAYPVDYDLLSSAARRAGVALELNNSKVAMRRTCVDSALSIIRACIRTGCSLVVNSDAHSVNELGNDQAVRPLLKRECFPARLLVNDTVEKAFALIDGRKDRKHPDFPAREKPRNQEEGDLVLT